MLRTNTVLLHPDEAQGKELQRLADASARLWNKANYQRRQPFFYKRRTPSYPFQCNRFKDDPDFKLLGTCKAQALLQKLAEAWASFFELLQLEKEGKLPSHIKKVKPPGYWKDRDTKKLIPKGIFVRNDGYTINERLITVSRGPRIQYASGTLWIGSKQGRLEIQYDELSKRWYAHQPVTVEQMVRHRPRRNASIDLGVCNLITAVMEGIEQPIIYSGRAVLSDWIYWTKRIAAEQSRLQTINHKHNSKKLDRLYRRRQRHFKHAVYAMLRDLFERLEEAVVTELTVGDITGIRDEAKYTSRTNQKIHNFWSFQKITQRINELGDEYGIEVIPKSEAYSSKDCCLCGTRHRNGRKYRGLCRCSKHCVVINADVNGSTNIADDGPIGNGGASGSGHMAMPQLLRWDGCRWEGRSSVNTREMIVSEARTRIPRYDGESHRL